MNNKRPQVVLDEDSYGRLAADLKEFLMRHYNMKQLTEHDLANMFAALGAVQLEIKMALREQHGIFIQEIETPRTVNQ